MEEDSGSMGLIGEVVGFDDRIQEEQMHTGNKEHSLNSLDPVNHVREPRRNIGNVFTCACVEMNWLKSILLNAILNQIVLHSY
jgi:hypothetical protein